MLLQFSDKNAKLEKLRKSRKVNKWLKKGRKIYSLNLPAGRTCPGAKDCKSMSVFNLSTGKTTIKDGQGCQFRCYAASLEALYPRKRGVHYRNFWLLKNTKGWKAIYRLLVDSLPADLGVLRIHDSGDFFKFEYLRAVYELAKNRPDILIYGYTKSLPFFQKLGMQDPANGVVLPNFLITASRGGKYDSLIPQMGIREVVVVGVPNEVDLSVDSNDSRCATPGGSFALLVHGAQSNKHTYGKYVWRGVNKSLLKKVKK